MQVRHNTFNTDDMMSVSELFKDRTLVLATVAEKVLRVQQGFITKIITLTARLDGRIAMEPFQTVSLEEIEKKLFSDLDEVEEEKCFKEELYQEITEKKISKIKYYRIISKMTQKDLAERLEMAQPNVARLEKVGHRTDIETLKLLGQAFKIDYKELID